VEAAHERRTAPGSWSGWTYVLSGLSLSGAAFFRWQVARRLVGARIAGMAVLLQGLHLGFSQRAELYNHNTVLVLFSVMTVCAVLRALEGERSRDWMLAGTGACAGLAMLSKYQAVVILSGIDIALARSCRGSSFS
jgi:4-amino-4-deoxy-L-arabinose transferase-like glycosyltransferase